MIYCNKCGKPSTGKRVTCPHCGNSFPREPIKSSRADTPPKQLSKEPAGQEQPDMQRQPKENNSPQPAEKVPPKDNGKQAGKQKSPRMLLGEILIAAGMLSAEQLQSALSQQKEVRQRLGTILIQNRIINEHQLVQALSHQSGIPWIDLSKIQVSKALARLIPYDMAEKYGFVPFDTRTAKDGKKILYLAMDDAKDKEAVQEASSASAMYIMPMFAGRSVIYANIQSLYQLTPTVVETRVVNVDAYSSTQDPQEDDETIPDETLLSPLIEPETSKVRHSIDPSGVNEISAAFETLKDVEDVERNRYAVAC